MVKFKNKRDKKSTFYWSMDWYFKTKDILKLLEGVDMQNHL